MLGDGREVETGNHLLERDYLRVGLKMLVCCFISTAGAVVIFSLVSDGDGDTGDNVGLITSL